jgi:hypothetical protein
MDQLKYKCARASACTELHRSGSGLLTSWQKFSWHCLQFSVAAVSSHSWQSGGGILHHLPHPHHTPIVIMTFCTTRNSDPQHHSASLQKKNATHESALGMCRCSPIDPLPTTTSLQGIDPCAVSAQCRHRSSPTQVESSLAKPKKKRRQRPPFQHRHM